MLDKGKKDGMMLAIGIGKPKHGGDMPEEEMSEPKDDSHEEFQEFASEAYEAAKAGDKESYIEALKGAIESCMSAKDEY